MKLIATVLQCAAGMEKISKRLILTGYVFAVFLYLCGFVALLIYDNYIADFTTGYYWYQQISRTSAEVFSATAVPSLLFEILCIVTGSKTKNEK